MRPRLTRPAPSRFAPTRPGLVLALCLTAGVARAQSVSPMEIDVRSASDSFLATVEVANPYREAKRFEMVTYSEDDAPVAVWLSVRQFDLGPGARRRIVISAPFDGAEQKRLLICAETIAGETANGRIRGQVCARVSARRYFLAS